MPLKNDFPVLIQTAYAKLSIKNAIYFDEYDYFRSNQLSEPNDQSFNERCVYLEWHQPFKKCSNFHLFEISKMANSSYEEMAKHGAIILITIKWDCWLPSWFGPGNDCIPIYKFKRIDKDDNDYQRSNFTYTNQLYFENGTKRTFIRSHRIRFKVDVSATLYRYDLYEFVTSLSAYSGLFFMISIPFHMGVTYWLRDYHIQDNIKIHNKK